ncbi:MAG: sigma-70 family RNA polymerase sigma factor [Planctomycetaceae bacterium]|nr:sigma-70 family RNA polymerase sigma factor [Planctomycetaceae bacterium]
MSPQHLYLENEGWLRTVVRSRIAEPEAVEDVMQNIALALVRQRDSLGDVRKIGAWLYQVAVRQVMMYRRSRGRRRRFEDRLAADPGSPSPSQPLDPVSRVLAAEEQELVQRAMQQLGEIDRQVLYLKYAEGWTYSQLAERLGVKEDTIEYRLARARRKLRRLLAKDLETR